MLKKVFFLVVVTLVYIYLLTIIFEYCINEVSSTAITLAGVVLGLLISIFYARLIFKILKK